MIFRRVLVSRRDALALLLTALAAGPAAAQQQQRPDSAADLQRVEAYLNSIHTLRARFVQVAGNGGTAEGTILIKRPGKLKLDYAPPSKQMIVTTSNFVAYVDKDAKQTSYQDLNSSLAGILVRPQIKLSGDIRVTDVTRSPGVIRTRLVLAKEPDAGSITLVFADNPLELRQWLVVDPQGNSVEVTLMNAQFGVPIDDKEFAFIDPNSPVAKELMERR
jgi:outer membrane lipoprotein-sorting protein